jgi:hypothetical protein
MDVVSDDAELGCRRIEAVRVGQSTPDFFEAALLMGPHLLTAEGDLN